MGLKKSSNRRLFGADSDLIPPRKGGARVHHVGLPLLDRLKTVLLRQLDGVARRIVRVTCAFDPVALCLGHCIVPLDNFDPVLSILLQ
jgi:hypothetical protein